MDFVRPVEAVIPGVQGRVLGVLTRTDVEMTMRTVASLAGVSVNRAVSVLNNLISLGLVERREAGSAALVRLARDNEAARAVIALADLRETVTHRLTETLRYLEPAPTSVVVFGSFARGQADADSDIDILVVRPDTVQADKDSWTDSIARWTTQARAAAGNPVNVIEATQSEVPRLIAKRGSVWQTIAKEGVTLAGSEISATSSSDESSEALLG